MNNEEVRDYALNLNEQVTEELFVDQWIYEYEKDHCNIYEPASWLKQRYAR